jgi:hypothetical protein
MFQVGGLAPGVYLVAAVDTTSGDGLAAGGLQDPDVLEWLSSRATRATLGEGARATPRLRLIRK